MTEAQVYERTDGSRPFDDRFDALEARAAGRITTAVGKLERRLRPKVMSVGGGVQEARVDHGTGYRMYFGIDGTDLVVLRLRGDKRTQHEDIEYAKVMWKEYRARKRPPADQGEGQEARRLRWH